MWMCVLHVYMCTVCVQCLWKPEKVLRDPGPIVMGGSELPVVDAAN